jgi:nucleoside-triphosphatase THEP1
VHAPRRWCIIAVMGERSAVDPGVDDPSDLASVVVLYGARGAGKTTTVLRLAELLRAEGLRVGGFLQQAVVDDLGRRGYELVHLAGCGQSVSLARPGKASDAEGELTACSFAFSRDAFAAGRAWLREDATRADVLVIDEVSKLEVGGQGHCEALRWALALGGGMLLLLSVRADQLFAVVDKLALYDRIRDHVELPLGDADLADAARRLAAACRAAGGTWERPPGLLSDRGDGVA